VETREAYLVKREAYLVKREALKNEMRATGFMIWQKSPVPERGNDGELDKMSLTVR